MEAPIQIPNFELLQQIGQGGMSRVYLARQLQPKRDVAIKIVSPGSAPDPAFLSSLKIEGDTIASLNHDNVVTVFACGVVDNHYFLAMEVLPGGDLTDRIKKGLRPDDAVEVMIQIGGALAHAHKRQILHRDIKPENVMFHESGKAVLVDFGIAKEGTTESSFTQVGAVVGTPHYMSPERCMGKETDARSDLYAMGVMFFEMLTGHKVFEGRDTFAVSYAHVYEPVPPLPPEHARYQGVVNKLLAKDPKDRYQDANEMVTALKKYRAGAPASAEPATRRVDTSVSSPLQAKLKQLADAADSTTVNEPVGSVNLHAPTAVAMPIGAGTPSKPALRVDTPGKPKPWLPIIAGVALLLIVGLAAALFWPKPPAPIDDTPQAVLTAQQRVDLSNALAAAQAFIRLDKFEEAADNYERVLSEYDPCNSEALQGLKATATKERYEKIFALCKK
jgi:serine/threonine-protein kinase PpkA